MFSEQSEIIIRQKFDEQINNIKKTSLKRCKEVNYKGFHLGELINNYIDNNGDSVILLAKKVIYFHYKELQFYHENNKRIRKKLRNEFL